MGGRAIGCVGCGESEPERVIVSSENEWEMDVKEIVQTGFRNNVEVAALSTTGTIDTGIPEDLNQAQVKRRKT